MEMLVIIATTLFLLKSPQVYGNYLQTNNLVREGNHHSEEIVQQRLKEDFEEVVKKVELENIGREISAIRSQMHSMLQMVELQTVALQTLREKITLVNPNAQHTVMWGNHKVIGRRYWRKIRKELRSIRECSCRPASEIASDTEAETEVFKYDSTENKTLPEIDAKDNSSSGINGVSHSIDETNISVHETGRNLGSSDVFEIPDSLVISNESITKVTPIETNRTITPIPTESIHFPKPTARLLEYKRQKNRTISLNPLNPVDDDLANYDVEIDLTTGIVHGKSAPGLTWLLHPSWPENRKSDWTPQCRLQSVMKLSFSPPIKKAKEFESQRADHLRRKLVIDLWLQKPHRWIFNLGDSSTNDGLSGDGSTQQNDCEVEGYGDTFNVYRSDKAADPFNKTLYKKKGFLKDHVTFIVSDQSLFWNNHNGNINTLNDSTLFALNGQPDSQGQINSDIYLALNRVISGDYRNGWGLCRAALKWLP